MSAVRWALLDHLHHRTGIPEPRWDFGKFPANVAAFDSHVDDHYRYYQFYANMLVAVAFAYGTGLLAHARWPGQQPGRDLAFLCVGMILFFGSRDTLRKYYLRTAAVLGCGPQVADSPTLRAAPLPEERRGETSIPEQDPAHWGMAQKV